MLEIADAGPIESYPYQYGANSLYEIVENKICCSVKSFVFIKLNNLLI